MEGEVLEYFKEKYQMANFRVMNNCYPNLKTKEEVDRCIEMREDAFKCYFKDEDK